MSKAKKKAPGRVKYFVDVCEVGYCSAPLSGLNRLVRIQRHNRNGVLYCDNVTLVSEKTTFSKDQGPMAPFESIYRSNAEGAYCVPRQTTAAKEGATGADCAIDDATGDVIFRFTPEGGQTYLLATDNYRLFDAGYRFARGYVPEDMLIARLEFKLDISGYLRAGFTIDERPQCELQEFAKDKKSANDASGYKLQAVQEKAGVWRWRVDDIINRFYRITWAFGCRNPSRAHGGVNLEKLTTELSVNPRVAKDLHNFVAICHYYAAGFRSLRKICTQMIADKAMLVRSLELIEDLIGAEVIQRTKGKGLIHVTAAGEAVLDWWSRYYMRWTPIFANPDAIEPVAEKPARSLARGRSDSPRRHEGH